MPINPHTHCPLTADDIKRGVETLTAIYRCPAFPLWLVSQRALAEYFECSQSAIARLLASTRPKRPSKYITSLSGKRTLRPTTNPPRKSGSFRRVPHAY